MKRILFLLLFYLFLVGATIDTFEGHSVDTSHTIEGTDVADTMEGQTIKSACGDCDNQGGAEVWMDFEHTTSNTTVCSVGDTSLSLDDASISTSQNHSAVACDGAADESFYVNNQASYYGQLDVTGGDIFSSANGYWHGWIYMDTSVNDVTIFDAYKDADDYMWIRIIGSGGNYVSVRHVNGGTVVTMTSNGVCYLADDAWTEVIVRWGDGADMNGGGEEMAIYCGSWVYESDADDLAAFDTGEPTYIDIIGCDNLCNGADQIYFDDIKLYITNDGS